VEQPDEIGFGVVKDLLEHLGTMAHFHHRHAASLVVGDLRARALQHLEGQHGRAGGKVIDTLGSHVFSSLIR
jgi:hypothetical protein